MTVTDTYDETDTFYNSPEHLAFSVYQTTFKSDPDIFISKVSTILLMFLVVIPNKLIKCRLVLPQQRLRYVCSASKIS